VPYFLAEQAGHMHPEQYVHSLGGALRGERDSVDPQTLSEYARQNRDKDRVRKLEEVSGGLAGKRSIDDRLRELRQMGALDPRHRAPDPAQAQGTRGQAEEGGVRSRRQICKRALGRVYDAIPSEREAALTPPENDRG
jgi:hypothetical protein